MFGGFVIDDSEMVSSKSEAMTLAVDLSSPLALIMGCIPRIHGDNNLCVFRLLFVSD